MPSPAVVHAEPSLRPGGVGEAFVQRIRAREAAELAPSATPSYPARRARAEADCTLRTPFQRDRDRIVHSKAFRRLKHKTQVFVAPRGDHYRTRLTHTLEVCGIARTVARALALNEDLTEAVALGHDLGHPPFGHAGEAALDACVRERGGVGFHHWEHSLRLVDRLGLNLTEPVRDGIAHHSGGSSPPATLEGAIVRLVDRFAYLNHDIDDALRAGVLHRCELPADALAVLGHGGPARIDALVHDLVEHSAAAEGITQGAAAAEAMAGLRAFMFERVYLGTAVRREHAKVATVVRTVFEHYCATPERLPAGEGAPVQRAMDYVAGMTDRFCLRAFAALTVPGVAAGPGPEEWVAS
jgi:dGTPase